MEHRTLERDEQIQGPPNSKGSLKDVSVSTVDTCFCQNKEWSVLYIEIKGKEQNKVIQ